MISTSHGIAYLTAWIESWCRPFIYTPFKSGGEKELWCSGMRVAGEMLKHDVQVVHESEGGVDQHISIMKF